MIKSRRLRAEVRMITDRDPGGLYQLSDKCTKTGLVVIDILGAKHSKGVIPEFEYFDEYPAIVTTKC